MHSTARPPGLTHANPDELKQFQRDYPAWNVVKGTKGLQQLERAYPFINDQQALVFTNRIAELAEAENHHPQLLLAWRNVTVTGWAHAIHGLHRKGLIVAAKTEQLYSRLQE